jgi:hypothetical protein
MKKKQKTPLELTVASFAKERRALQVLEHGLRLCRLQRAKFTETLQGRPLKKWEYLLARWIKPNLGNIEYPFLDMKCRAWELWIFPNGDIRVRLIDRPLGTLVLRRLEYTIGHAPVG